MKYLLILALFASTPLAAYDMHYRNNVRIKVHHLIALSCQTKQADAQLKCQKNWEKAIGKCILAEAAKEQKNPKRPKTSLETKRVLCFGRHLLDKKGFSD